MVLDLRSLPSLVFLKLDRKWTTDGKFCDHVTSINRFKEAERVKNLLLSGSENGKFRSCPVFRTNFFLPYLPSSISVLLSKLIRQRQPIKTLKLHLSSLLLYGSVWRVPHQSSTTASTYISGHISITSNQYEVQTSASSFRSGSLPVPWHGLLVPNAEVCSVDRHKAFAMTEFATVMYQACVRTCRPATQGWRWFLDIAGALADWNRSDMHLTSGEIQRRLCSSLS